MTPDQHVLEGRFVRLEPLAPGDRDGLAAIFEPDADQWDVDSVDGCGGHFLNWWEDAVRSMSDGDRQVYTVRRRVGSEIVGTMSLLNARPATRAVECGAALLSPQLRSEPGYVEAFHLLLGHAFACDAMRVEFLIDVRAARSRAAAQKLGATREGVLRRHRVTVAGQIRDTAVFSIVDLDWPVIQARQRQQLAVSFIPKAA
jgi:RimJ/RimL family protein N-acetyltransferase